MLSVGDNQPLGFVQMCKMMAIDDRADVEQFDKLGEVCRHSIKAREKNAFST